PLRILCEEEGNFAKYVLIKSAIRFKKQLILPKYSRDHQQTDVPFVQFIEVMVPILVFGKYYKFRVDQLYKSSGVASGIFGQIKHVICQRTVFANLISRR